MHRILFTLVLGVLFLSNALAQGVRGFVYDENNIPMPGVGVYIKNSGSGTYTDSDGRYYIDLRAGEYQLVYSFTGYKNVEHSIIFEKKDIVENVWLSVDEEILGEVVIKANRRDPAFAIMHEASKRKGDYLKQYESLTSQIYIKASEQDKEKKNKRQKKKESTEKEEAIDNTDIEDGDINIENPFEDSVPKFNTNNLVEVFLTKHFQYPNKHKEIRTGYNLVGGTYGLYYLSTVDDEINFYNGLLHLDKLTETPIISPLNSTAVLTYKFKLLESYLDEQERKIYKIQVTPRKKGNASISGIVHIYDKTYSIKELDLTLEKGNLINFDEFNVIQKYSEIDSLWILDYQEFNYFTKTKARDFRGRTVVKYSDFELNPEFSKRFFSNELGVTTKEAYERDSSYWEDVRPEPLTKEEQRFIYVNDSVYEAHNRKEYLDSVDALYNKFTIGKLVYLGVGYRNRAKKFQYDFGTIQEYIQPFGVGGARISPYFSYFKKWENERFFNSYQQASVGLRNGDIKGGFHPSFYYSPFHLGRVSAGVGRDFDVINGYDAIINLLSRRNWIQRDYYRLSHQIEIVNGLYSYVGFNFNNRQSISDLEFNPFLDQFIPNNTPIEFKGYQALITTVYLSYIPAQKYMREPNRKVVLGSKWPEFRILYNKGIKSILGSDIDFDYLGGSISQSIKLITLGTFNYKIKGGKFLNTKTLRFIDYKFFRQSDPWLYSNPLNSFQLLQTSLSAIDYYTEAHFMHHFNGALINNFPILKKSKIKTVFGGGTLWIKESNYIHQELITGIERNFRIHRQRFRLGAYYIVSKSNQTPLDSGVKFSIEFYNNRENKWSF